MQAGNIPTSIDSTRTKANRVNAQKSTGPKTPAGKRNSSRNALRHGLRARDLTLIGESESDYLNLLASLEGEFNPQSATERDLIAATALARWRMLRTASAEKVILDDAMKHLHKFMPASTLTKRQSHGLAFRHLADNPMPILASIDRTELRCQRLYDRAFSDLLTLRRLRKKHPENEQTKPPAY